MVESNPEIQHHIGMIVLDILRFLVNQSDSDPRSIPIANSIWQSLRVDEVEGLNDKTTELPDEVDEAFFDEPSMIEGFFKTLQFDRTPGGSYSQVWLIDRIMSKGRYTVDRSTCAQSSCDYDGPQHKPQRGKQRVSGRGNNRWTIGLFQ